MGMILRLMRISDLDLAKFQGRPELVSVYINRNTPRRKMSPDQERARAQLAKELGLPVEDDNPVQFESYPFIQVFDVNKLWHGLYFLLTGTNYEAPPPAGWLLNGPAVGTDDGYGPAIRISAAHTRTLSQYLDGLDTDEVVGRFDAKAMKALDLYPDIWDEDPASLKAELGGAFSKLQDYCRQCAQFGFGMLSYM